MLNALARFSLVLFAAAAAALVPGCKPPREKTPEGTLAMLRDALVTGRPPFSRVADTRIVDEATFLDQANRARSQSGLALAPSAIELARQRIDARADPQSYFAGARTLLRNGRCEKIADAQLPEALRQSPAPNPEWPRSARELQVSVARRLIDAFAAEYRCDGGPSFTAIFVRPHPNDGTWRVAALGPAAHP